MAANSAADASRAARVGRTDDDFISLSFSCRPGLAARTRFDTGVNFSCDTTSEMYYNFEWGCQSPVPGRLRWKERDHRSEEHTSELPSLIRISFAVFCLKINNN